MADVKCPNCATEFRPVRVSDPACVTCGRPISEHIKRFGHDSWCAFEDKVTA